MHKNTKKTPVGQRARGGLSARQVAIGGLRNRLPLRDGRQQASREMLCHNLFLQGCRYVVCAGTVDRLSGEVYWE